VISAILIFLIVEGMNGPDCSPHEKSANKYQSHHKLLGLPSCEDQNWHAFIKMLLIVLPGTFAVDNYLCQIYEQ
jgi:hypothetical protein